MLSYLLMEWKLLVICCTYIIY